MTSVFLTVNVQVRRFIEFKFDFHNYSMSHQNEKWMQFRYHKVILCLRSLTLTHCIFAWI